MYIGGHRLTLEFDPVNALKRSLYVQVIVAIALGILLGSFDPAAGAAMKPLGGGFVKLAHHR